MHPMQGAELEEVRNAICELLTTLFERRETHGGRATIRFHAVGHNRENEQSY